MEDQSGTSQPGAASEEDTVRANQASSVIEIRDSASECEGELRPSPLDMEEKSFVSSLYGFMKDKSMPIERIPHLGFKQINLWRIYKAVDKLGGYDSVTAGRLWKNVYDELGGSPGSTSAATCTRRHYERLVLPFERHLRGEENKPLPPGKPRKQYKRNLGGMVSKAEGKRKRTQSEREMDSSEAQVRPEVASLSETGTRGHPTSWAIASDKVHPVCSQPNSVDGELSSGFTYSHLIQVPTSCPWGGYIATAGEVISPLEKKKRVAQASLSLPLSPRQGEGKEDRPSVIHCSPSPGLAPSSQTCNSSEGSPLPLSSSSSSSSSSRSPSPYSVSSEDSPLLTQNKPASNTELPPNCSSNFSQVPVSGCNEDNKSLSCSPTTKDPVGQYRAIPLISPQPPNIDSNKGQSGGSRDSAWSPVHTGSGRYPAHPWALPTPCSPTVKSDWIPASTSSFTKVIPKYVEPLRPIPFQPTYKLHQRRAIPHNDLLACEKKLHNMVPWLHQTEKKKSRAMVPKPLPTQQTMSHSNASLPVSYLLTGYDRSGRDLRHQPPLHPAFLPTRMRPPLSQPVYRHVMMGHSALYGSAIYSYPYTIPLWNPQTGYNMTSMNSNHPHKL